MFASLAKLEVLLMAQQDQVNTDVAQISDALNGLSSELTDLKNQLAAQVPDTVDLSGLDALAQKAASLVPQQVSTDQPTPTTDPSVTPDASSDVNPAPDLSA